MYIDCIIILFSSNLHLGGIWMRYVEYLLPRKILTYFP